MSGWLANRPAGRGSQAALKWAAVSRAEGWWMQRERDSAEVRRSAAGNQAEQWSAKRTGREAGRMTVQMAAQEIAMQTARQAQTH